MNEWMRTLAAYETECPLGRLATAPTPGHTEGEKLSQCSGGNLLPEFPARKKRKPGSALPNRGDKEKETFLFTNENL